MDIAKSDLTQSQREETYALIRENVKDFAALYIKPHIRDWDEKKYFPKELFHRLGEPGLMGMLVPERFGGSGLGHMK